MLACRNREVNSKARVRTPRLATPAFLSEWTGLSPFEVRLLCDAHPGTRRWSGGPVINVREFLDLLGEDLR